MFNAKTGVFALIALAALALVLIVAQSAREDSDAGQQAWDAGRVDEAVAQWRAAADEGDRRAMLSLGRIYAKGMGVLQDPVEAHKWFNLAASLGETAAVEERDALAALMTPMELAAARQRAEVERERQEHEARERLRIKDLRFKDCVGCPELVVVPAGSFMMGSPESEKGRDDDEGPVHEVTIPKPFAVGVYEVTFDEWDACSRAGGCTHNPDDEGWGRGNRPVINVSWDDAQEYVRWLSGKTGRAYRLLSQSEWEYAARAGTRARYWWGDGIGSNRANCDGCGSRWDAKQTAPVGSFSANAFGLYDVSGNAWELVGDCWNFSYKGAPVDGSVWESGKCKRRMLRGGSWVSHPRYLRSASRSSYTTEDRLSNVGFRVARTLAP